MKKLNHIFLPILFLSALFILNGCAKSETDPEKEIQIGVANPTDDFKWTPTSGLQVTADSSHYYSSFTTIFAFKSGNANSVEINLASLAVGTYSISSVTGNALSYVKDATTYNASAGSVTISSHADNKIAGSFSCTFTGSLAGLSGFFVDVPAK